MSRSERLQVRISPQGMQAIDKLRGEVSRSDWVRQILADAVKRGVKGVPTYSL